MSEILKYPAAHLRQPCEVVTGVEDLQGLVTKMETVLRSTSNNFGIAANQVGVCRQVIMMKKKGGPLVMINPIIMEEKGGHISLDEGSVSAPGIYVPIKRPRKCKVGWMNETGAIVSKQFKGMDARIVQHLIDQMNGVLFIDRAKEQGTWKREHQQKLRRLMS